MPDYETAIRLRATDETGPATDKAQERLKLLKEGGKIPISIIDRATEPLKRVGDQIKEIGKLAVGFTLGQALFSLTSDFSEKFKEAVTSIQSVGQATFGLMQITGLSAEATSGLLTVMERFGLSSDTATGSITRLSRAVQSIRDGGAAAMASTSGVGQAFKDLGISVAEVKTGNVSDVLMLIADRFKEIPDATVKANAALKLFGRGVGPDMVAFLSQGSEAIKELEADAAKYGLTLSTENVAQVREFTMAHKSLDEALQGVMIQMGIAFIPAMTAGAEALGHLAEGFNSQVMPSIRAFGPALAAAMDMVGPPIQMVANAIGTLVTRGWLILFSTLRSMVDWINGSLLPTLRGLWELLSPTREWIGSALTWLFQTAWPNFLRAIQPVVDFIEQHLNPILQTLSGYLNAIGNAKMPDFSGIPTTPPAAAAATGNLLGGAMDFGAAASQTAKNIGDNLYDGLRAALPQLDPLWDTMQSVADRTFDTITAYARTWANGLRDLASGDFTGAINEFITAFGLIPPMLIQNEGDWLHFYAVVGDAILTHLPSWTVAVNNWLESYDVAFDAAFYKAVADLEAQLPGWQAALAAWSDAAGASQKTASEQWLAQWVAMGTNVSNWVAQQAPILAGQLGLWSGELVGWILDAGVLVPAKLEEYWSDFSNWINGAGSRNFASAGTSLGDAFGKGLADAIESFITTVEGRLSDLGSLVGKMAQQFGTGFFQGVGQTTSTAQGNPIPHQQGGWLREPILGVGVSGRRYSFVENGRPEYVAPSGAAAPTGGSAQVTLHVHPGAVQISGSNSATQDIAAAADGLWADLYARLDRALSNRPLGRGRLAY